MRGEAVHRKLRGWPTAKLPAILELSDDRAIDLGARLLLDGDGAHVRRCVGAGRKPTRELVAEPVREDRTEDGDADRAAYLPEQRRA